MKHIINYLLTGLLVSWLVGPGTVSAQDVRVLSLDDILMKIDQQNVALDAFELRARGYAYRAEAAGGWMAPMAGAGTYMTPYPGQNPMEDDKGALMLQAEQQLPNFSKQKAMKTAIRSRAAIEEASRAVALNELKAQAKLIYYRWLVALERLDLLAENQALVATMKEMEEIRYKYNLTQLGNIFNADAKMEEIANNILVQNSVAEESRAWLTALMNEKPGAEWTIDTAQNKSFRMEASLDTANLATRRKDIERIDREIRSIAYERDAVRQDRRPGLSLRLDHMSPLGAGMMPNSFSVMGMISIPIAPWSSKSYKNEVKAMGLEISAMQKEREGELLQAQGRLFGMQGQLRAMEERLANMEDKIIPSLRRAMDANFQSYQENKLQLPEVLANWEAWNLMRHNLLDVKMDYYQLIVDYEKELYR